LLVEEFEMKALLLLVLLVSVISFGTAQNPIKDVTAPVVVLGFKWFKDRRAADTADTTGSNSPAPAMIAANRNFERQRRVNDPAGVRDPNADTLDGRSAALDRIVEESRENKPRVDGYTYQARIQNHGPKTIKSVFWEYQFREQADPATMSRRQFVCAANVKPQKTKDLEIFSLAAPTGVISVDALTKKASTKFDEAVLINRVEYEDGSIWQRKGWNYDDVKLTANPASAARKVQMCRGL